MDNWRVGRLVVLAGGVGMAVAAALAAAAYRGGREFLGRGTTGSLALSLLVLGLSAWHFRAWGIGKLVVVGVVAWGLMSLTLVDFGDGSPLWDQHYEGTELAARWLLIGSAGVVVLGVLWSLAELLRTDREEVAASLAWWRRWGVLVGGVGLALLVGWQVRAAIQDEDGSPAGIEDGDDGDGSRVVEDQWTITTDGDVPGSYLLSLIRTFAGVGEPDEGGVGGRLVWPETEVALCDVAVRGGGDGFLQVGVVSPTTEGCPGMLAAFVDFGVPETVCLSVRSNGVDDEYCAPPELD